MSACCFAYVLTRHISVSLGESLDVLAPDTSFGTHCLEDLDKLAADSAPFLEYILRWHVTLQAFRIVPKIIVNSSLVPEHLHKMHIYMYLAIYLQLTQCSRQPIERTPGPWWGPRGLGTSQAPRYRIDSPIELWQLDRACWWIESWSALSPLLPTCRPHPRGRGCRQEGPICRMLSGPGKGYHWKKLIIHDTDREGKIHLSYRTK